MEIKNSTILVTGGTSGFGLEFVKQLTEQGAKKIIITGRDAAKLEQTKKMFPQIHTYQSDVSKPEDIHRLFLEVTTRFPDLNILINNAGEMRKIILQEMSDDLHDITREIDINLMGPIRMVQQFYPHLKTKKSAAILNVTSGIALMPFPISPIYGASKSGLRSYTQSLRAQLKKTSIKVFELVAPGSSTPLNDKFKSMKGFNPDMLMAPDKIVKAAVNGLLKDKYEIYPGLASVMKMANRIAPKFMMAQAAKMSGF